ncbi:hypothetical protein BV25DRAFT_1916019 [Artomyces pyxidatus]|uniref:Uncharacterized protein n=1 Tax=Artomyces pyxidatus TaxID=48021 RepID=A0ACB8T137_9AGAM|nr:hypothetical protein BV25DRAFT_1916019 [Artomyces pyxidatus]
MNGEPENDTRVVDKGKGRANTPEPTEVTPLLASPSYTTHDDLETSHHTRHRLRSTLTTVFLITLSLCIIVLLLLGFLAYTYAAKASHVSNDDILNKALVFKGPDYINVLNITDGGEIWVKVHGRVGVDAGAVMEVNPDSTDNVWLDIWKFIGRWGIQKLDSVSVNLSSIDIHSRDEASTLLASVWTPPLQLPLTADPPSDLSWLTKVSLPVRIRPTQNTSVWIDFARESWRRGYIVAQAAVAEAVVEGGPWNSKGWRSVLKVERSDLVVPLRLKIPLLHGLPAPGHGFPDVADLVHLEYLNVYSDFRNLSLTAGVTVVNPAPSSVSFTSPPVPFVVWIPSSDNESAVSIPIASVTSAPFTLTHPNITLTLNGLVLPLSSESAPTLSKLVSEYLSGKDSPISITTPFLPGLEVPTVFPAPHPKPEILRNVTIKDMKIKAVGQTIVASGLVLARVVLPKGLNARVSVSRVLPDVLIFDGEIGSQGVPTTPLPDPLPERAFAHIRPDDWLDALSAYGEPEEGEGSVTLVSARIVDVPLEVLPGREREFSNFVGKVIFGTQGALAGVQGVAAVTVHVDGLPIGNGTGTEDGMVLTGLPFQGSVRIGKRGL